MDITLANKYRPQEFEDVCTQEVNTKILNKQIKEKSYSHGLLFAGPAGCGKTTCARIFANKVNGEILELDCASKNGVADVKEIIDLARTKPLIYDYKIIIMDEAQALSAQAWGPLLITLEENLPNAIFIFCTTNTEKIPSTIISRLQRYNFIPINDTDMMNRLKFICKEEKINISDDSLSYIVKTANGNLRQALTNLDKCILYDDLSIDAVCKVLNIVSKEVMDKLIAAYNEKNINAIISIIEDTYNNGYNLHQFIKQFLEYCLKLPNVDIKLIDTLLEIIREIRYDDLPKNLIIAYLII